MASPDVKIVLNSGEFNAQPEDLQKKLIAGTGVPARSSSPGKAIQAGISANLVSFQPGWDQGFKKDQFAVLPCPAWMLGHLQETAPDQKGKWDIATVPGGAGNRGGSFWTVPSQGRNVDAAVSFVKWLVQPEQQIAVENVITRV